MGETVLALPLRGLGRNSQATNCSFLSTGVRCKLSDHSLLEEIALLPNLLYIPVKRVSLTVWPRFHNY